MFLFRTSASNCARIYNDGIALKSLSSSLPAAYSKSFTLDVEEVWNGLFLYWLLQDAEERIEDLELVHNAPSQAKRLEPALRARNLRIAGTGQEAWNHVCDLCCWFNEQPDGQFSMFQLMYICNFDASKLTTSSFYSINRNRWCHHWTSDMLISRLRCPSQICQTLLLPSSPRARPNLCSYNVFRACRKGPSHL
jgi:hypothetical protein